MDEQSKEESKEEKKIGGLIKFRVPGKFLHFNTIEEYTAFDLSSLNSEETRKVYRIPDSWLNSSNYFVFACFGDLKNYNFHFKIGLAQQKEKIQTVKGKKLVKQLQAEEVTKLREAIFKQVKGQAENTHVS